MIKNIEVMDLIANEEKYSEVYKSINNAIINQLSERDKNLITTNSIYIHTIVRTIFGNVCEVIDTSFGVSHQMWFSRDLTVTRSKEFQNKDEVFEIRIIDFKLKKNRKYPNRRLFVIKDYEFVSSSTRKEFDFVQNVLETKGCDKAIVRQSERVETEKIFVITTREELSQLNCRQNCIVLHEFIGTMGPQSEDEFCPVFNFWVFYLRETKTGRNAGYLLVDKESHNLDSFVMFINKEVVLRNVRFGKFLKQNVLLFSEQSVVELRGSEHLLSKIEE